MSFSSFYNSHNSSVIFNCSLTTKHCSRSSNLRIIEQVQISGCWSPKRGNRKGTSFEYLRRCTSVIASASYKEITAGRINTVTFARFLLLVLSTTLNVGDIRHNDLVSIMEERYTPFNAGDIRYNDGFNYGSKLSLARNFRLQTSAVWFQTLLYELVVIYNHYFLPH